MNLDNEMNRELSGRIIPVMPAAIGIYKLGDEVHKKFKDKINAIDSKASDKLKRNDVIQKEKLRHISNNRNKNIFRDFPELKPLKTIFEQYAINYLWETGFYCPEVVITDAWLNIGSKESVLHPHLHSNSYLSGNYFINYNSELHTPLNFYNDRLMNGTERKPFISVQPRNKKTIFNIRDVALAVSEGDIIIWRSHLLHGFSKPNQADKRMTLSFNIMPKICHSGDQYSFVVSEEY